MLSRVSLGSAGRRGIQGFPHIRANYLQYVRTFSQSSIQLNDLDKRIGRTDRPSKSGMPKIPSKVGKSTGKIVPPSFKDAKPYTRPPEPIRTVKRPTEEDVLKSIENSMKEGNYKQKRFPMWMKFGILVVSTVVFMGGFVVYQTINGKPAFFPLWFSKTVPLNKAAGVEHIDQIKLKDKVKDTLLTKLSMNSTIRLLFGLPLQLGDFEKYDVSIEYKNYTMEGLQIDCTSGWSRPDISWRKREIVSIPENFNNVLEPLKVGGDDSYDPDEPRQRDYSILIEGRIGVLDSINAKVDKGTGAITFRGVIDFDHTKTVKLVDIIVSYKVDGHLKIDKLW